MSWQALFHVTSRAVEETRALRFGLVLEPRLRFLFVYGALQLCRNALEIPACLFIVAKAAPSIGESGKQLSPRMHAELSNGDVILRFITQNNWFIGRVAVEGRVKDPPNAGQLVNASRLELGELETEEKIQQGVKGIQQLFEAGEHDVRSYETGGER